MNGRRLNISETMETSRFAAIFEQSDWNAFQTRPRGRSNPIVPDKPKTRSNSKRSPRNTNGQRNSPKTPRRVDPDLQAVGGRREIPALIIIKTLPSELQHPNWMNLTLRDLIRPDVIDNIENLAKENPDDERLTYLVDLFARTSPKDM